MLEFALPALLLLVNSLAGLSFTESHAEVADRRAGEENGSFAYTVQPGDTLTGIAYQHGATILAILRANAEIVHPNRIYPGQVIVIPIRANGRPLVELSPRSGPPGTLLRVEASGFPPHSMVEVSVGKWRREENPIADLQTRSNGTLITQVLIPEEADFNERWVVSLRAVDSRDPQATQGSANFFVAREPSDTQPAIMVWPQTGFPGMELHVVGADFPPETLIDLGIGRWDSALDFLKTDMVEINGTFGWRATIPPGAQEGEEWLIVARTITDPVLEVSSDIIFIQPEDGNALTMASRLSAINQESVLRHMHK